eukprot:343180_1
MNAFADTEPECARLILHSEYLRVVHQRDYECQQRHKHPILINQYQMQVECIHFEWIKHRLHPLSNHPRIQNTNVERPKSYSFWKYCDNLEDAKKQRIVEILYGKTHVMVRGTQRRHCNAKQTQRRWIQYIEDISNGLERQTMEDKDWKNKEKAKI